MIDPLSGVGVNSSTGATGAQASQASNPTQSTSAPGVTGQTGQAPALDSQHVFRAVSDLLQNLGGGLENDQMLRMMLALLVLTALLQQDQEQTSGLWGGLANGLLAPQQGISAQGSQMYYASTTISITQTAAYVGSTGNLMGGEGGTVDLRA